ncbi:MAG: hypothetical protein E7190_13075 [Erysipelotrichaceae bacterium]|nr:hypothetical protein [Erysipelotrichaceae bacterium]
MDICRITLISSAGESGAYADETEQRLSIVSTGQIWFTSYRGKQPVRRIRCCSQKDTVRQILNSLSQLDQDDPAVSEGKQTWEALVTDRDGKDHYLSGGRNDRTAGFSEMLRANLAIRGLMAFDGPDFSGI